MAADVCCLLGDRGGGICTYRMCLGLGLGDHLFDLRVDRRHCHACAYATHRLKLLFETVDLFVGFTVDFVEPTTGVPDQLGGLLDRFRHVAVHVGLVDHRLRGAVGALAHSLDRLP
ncbi:hypothetical protein [Mycobacterium lehmannii]|uniref:hypothetical protein n=1 Tax=Mycobacterium lehmannii TaxID=2048550 RepID=UPI001E6511DE|nr:hypothetical protein [Mycobacterium lehmannii]